MSRGVVSFVVAIGLLLVNVLVAVAAEGADSKQGAVTGKPPRSEAARNAAPVGQAASDAAANPQADAKADRAGTAVKESSECVSANMTLVEPETLKRFRDTVVLQLSGACVVAFNASAARTGSSKAPTLYLDGVEMKGMPATPESRAAGTVDLAFSLARNSEDDDGRKTWDTLLAKQRVGFPMRLPVAVALGTSPAVVAAGEARLVFTTVQGGAGVVWAVVGVGIVALVLSFALLLKGNALRDDWGGPFSLGKSQMALWGLIVFLSFFGIWIITGTMEKVPVQTLVLLGISGATGLAAVMIGNTKDSPSDAAAKLKLEGDAIVAKGAAATAQEGERLVKINQDLIAISAYASRRHKTLGDFFRDICDDGTGPSFHRIQVVIWTLLLGAFFVWSVTQVISMPEFPQTLLLLLGISNGTYLGFKFPEKV